MPMMSTGNGQSLSPESSGFGLVFAEWCLGKVRSITLKDLDEGRRILNSRRIDNLQVRFQAPADRRNG